MTPIARTATAFKATEAEKILKAHEGKEQKLFALIQQMYGTNPITSLDSAITELTARKARSEGQMRMLADMFPPDVTGNPGPLDGHRSDTVEKAMLSILRVLEAQAKTRREAAAAVAKATDLEVQLVAVNTNNHNLQISMQEMIAANAKLTSQAAIALNTMSEAIIAAQAGDQVNLAKLEAERDALRDQMAGHKATADRAMRLAESAMTRRSQDNTRSRQREQA
jgi:hypothetical protein